MAERGTSHEAEGPLRAAVVIPARYASTRLPGKMLLAAGGMPLIGHVWQRASKSKLAGRVVVATDDERILDAMRALGAEAEMTPVDCASGTDRIAHLVLSGAVDAQIIVNVQGDEPEIDPAHIDRVISIVTDDDDVDIATLVVGISSLSEYRDPNAVKAVVAAGGRALYFSRAQVPFVRDGVVEGADFEALGIYRHVGLYAYRREALLRFAGAPESRLEGLEKLEQLRALEMGMVIKVAVVDEAAAGVDTIEDFKAFENRLQAT